VLGRECVDDALRRSAKLGRLVYGRECIAERRGVSSGERYSMRAVDLLRSAPASLRGVMFRACRAGPEIRDADA